MPKDEAQFYAASELYAHFLQSVLFVSFLFLDDLSLLLIFIIWVELLDEWLIK